ncbi:hypothetical protein [Neisseria perflava]|uniref:hypothetical protein n=1 Tax=Neisseria perflava TaxID=33053 RepID=UPI0020A07BE1|nr:hypothetical protein [Neisseria perflava]MCP1659143.1 hypothetical protein [Neisseria perflava]MCP1771360.1 hypothetical protein [Neisseria perflava]
MKLQHCLALTLLAVSLPLAAEVNEETRAYYRQQADIVKPHLPKQVTGFMT